MIRPRKIPAQTGFESRIFRSQGGGLNHYANEAVTSHSRWVLHDITKSHLVNFDVTSSALISSTSRPDNKRNPSSKLEEGAALSTNKSEHIDCLSLSLSVSVGPPLSLSLSLVPPLSHSLNLWSLHAFWFIIDARSVYCCIAFYLHVNLSSFPRHLSPSL